jgi:N-acetylmuramoyl-L-alanine amidase
MQEEYLENSISLASKIQDQFTIGLNRKSRGVKQAPFMVLHKAYMPRVLIETGFISNPKDGALLDSEEGQMQVAEAIADAIISYKKEYFGTGNNEPIDKPSKRVVEKPSKDSSTFTKQNKIIEPPVVKTPEIKKESTGIIFKVQIAAVGKKIELLPSNFKGLKNVDVSTENGTFYKYTYGETSDYATAKRNLEEAKSKGFDSAYLIAFKDGKKISIQEAIK